MTGEVKDPGGESITAIFETNRIPNYSLNTYNNR